MSFIEVENLKYRYPHTDKLALDGLCFQVEKGEFIGVAGSNKAGKSTLCQAMVGLVPTMFKGAYGGCVRIAGQLADKTPIAKLCGQVGLIFQNPFNQLSGAKETVFEEVAFGLQNLGVEPGEMVKRVEEALILMDISSYRDRNPFDLSGGQIQRVAIASILAMRPDVIVLDEPTSQLDPEGSEEVFQVVEKLSESGITIIMVEQKMEKLASYCHKILLLHEGRQMAFDTPPKIFSRDDLAELGMVPPVYTSAARTVGVRSDDGILPVTLEETVALKSRFPREDAAKTERIIGVKRDAALEEGRGKKQKAEDGEINSSTILKVDQLTFGYLKEKPVISDLYLTFNNCPTAIIGQNGAGKTTLVKLLKGLQKPDSGTIFYDGQDISGKTVAAMAGMVGYVFQNPDDQIFKTKVLDEVMVGPLNIGRGRGMAEEMAEKALDMVGLLWAADKNPYDLELSERKLVAIASVVAMDTKVVILDEPTIAQDAGGRRIIGDLIRKLSGDGKFLLAILHDMDFVAEYFERVIVMAHGRVLADGRGKDVFYKSDIIKEARIAQPHVSSLCGRLGYTDRYLTLEDMSRKLGAAEFCKRAKETCREGE